MENGHEESLSAFCYHFGFYSLVSADSESRSPTVALLEGGALCSEIRIDHHYHYTLFPLSNELSDVVTGVIFVVLGALVVFTAIKVLVYTSDSDHCA